MKITVITVCRNEVSTISRTLQSVMSQTHRDIEHVIIDGHSTDGTMAIIRQYASQADYDVIIQNDKSAGGIYAALNQALEVATGEIIATLHANDHYASDEELQRIAESFEFTGVDIVYGDVTFFRPSNPSKIVRHYSAKHFVRESLFDLFAPPHPATFFRRSDMLRQRGYSQDYVIAADFELMVRMLLCDNLSMHYVDRVVVEMSLGGISTRLKNRLITNVIEKWRALKNNNFRPSPTAILRRIGYAISK